MADWHKQLTPDEALRIAEIKQGITTLRAEHRRIFDRARKRAQRTS